MTIEELINNINKYNDPDADSDWKYGKNYGIMVAVQEVEKYREENDESNNQTTTRTSRTAPADREQP